MYLAMGMTYELFWEKESWLVKSYREAHRIQQDESNYHAWLCGAYVLNALQTGIPVVLNGIAKSHIDLPKYPDKPFYSDDMKKTPEELERERMEKQVAKMREIAEHFNSVFKRKHEQQTTQDSK